jgi:hypothetical protein
MRGSPKNLQFLWLAQATVLPRVHSPELVSDTEKHSRLRELAAELIAVKRRNAVDASLQEFASVAHPFPLNSAA